jgi:uncharacterized iron-regulated membrane protein
MTPRKILFWIHLPAGVLAGTVILVMSVTGVLLAYAPQITEWANRGYRSEMQAGRQRLSIEDLIERVRQVERRTPSAFTLRADPSAPVQFSFGRERTVYLNPYTGAGLGDGSPRLSAFFQQVTEVHRWLAMQGEMRETGRAITGACNLCFLILVITGPFIWWPKNWTWGNLRSITWFRGGLQGKPRDFNWHNVIGVWCAVPLFFIVLTGVIMSYPWANDLLYRATGNKPPPRAAAGQRASGERRARPDGEGKIDGLDRLVAQAERQVPGWQTITVRLPDSLPAPVAFTIDSGSKGRPDKRTQLTLDLVTGEIVKREPFSSNNLGRRLRLWSRFVHTGEAGGFIGQTLALTASAGAVMLAWTGLSLALRRLWAWRRRTQRDAAVTVEVR